MRPVIDIGDILQVSVKDGEPRAVLGDALTGEGRGGEVALWGVAGVYSFPMPPDENGAAQSLHIHDGNTLRSIATRDSRQNAKVGDGKSGDWIAVGGGEHNRIIMKAEDDSVTLFSEKSSKSMMITLSAGDEQILTTYGDSYLEMKVDSVVLRCGGAMIMLKDDTVTIIGSLCRIATTQAEIGLMPGGAPPALPAQGIAYGVQPGLFSATVRVAP